MAAPVGGRLCKTVFRRKFGPTGLFSRAEDAWHCIREDYGKRASKFPLTSRFLRTWRAIRQSLEMLLRRRAIQLKRVKCSGEHDPVSKQSIAVRTGAMGTEGPFYSRSTLAGTASGLPESRGATGGTKHEHQSNHQTLPGFGAYRPCPPRSRSNIHSGTKTLSDVYLSQLRFAFVLNRADMFT